MEYKPLPQEVAGEDLSEKWDDAHKGHFDGDEPVLPPCLQRVQLTRAEKTDVRVEETVPVADMPKVIESQEGGHGTLFCFMLHRV